MSNEKLTEVIEKLRNVATDLPNALRGGLSVETLVGLLSAAGPFLLLNPLGIIPAIGVGVPGLALTVSNLYRKRKYRDALRIAKEAEELQSAVQRLESLVTNSFNPKEVAAKNNLIRGEQEFKAQIRLLTAEIARRSLNLDELGIETDDKVQAEYKDVAERSSVKNSVADPLTGKDERFIISLASLIEKIKKAKSKENDLAPYIELAEDPVDVLPSKVDRFYATLSSTPNTDLDTNRQEALTLQTLIEKYYSAKPREEHQPYFYSVTQRNSLGALLKRFKKEGDIYLLLNPLSVLDEVNEFYQSLAKGELSITDEQKTKAEQLEKTIRQYKDAKPIGYENEYLYSNDVRDTLETLLKRFEKGGDIYNRLNPAPSAVAPISQEVVAPVPAVAPSTAPVAQPPVAPPASMTPTSVAPPPPPPPRQRHKSSPTESSKPVPVLKPAEIKTPSQPAQTPTVPTATSSSMTDTLSSTSRATAEFVRPKSKPTTGDIPGQTEEQNLGSALEELKVEHEKLVDLLKNARDYENVILSNDIENQVQRIKRVKSLLTNANISASKLDIFIVQLNELRKSCETVLSNLAFIAGREEDKEQIRKLEEEYQELLSSLSSISTQGSADNSSSMNATQVSNPTQPLPILSPISGETPEKTTQGAAEAPSVPSPESPVEDLRVLTKDNFGEIFEFIPGSSEYSRKYKVKPGAEHLLSRVEEIVWNDFWIHVVYDYNDKLDISFPNVKKITISKTVDITLLSSIMSPHNNPDFLSRLFPQLEELNILYPATLYSNAVKSILDYLQNNGKSKKTFILRLTGYQLYDEEVEQLIDEFNLQQRNKQRVELKIQGEDDVVK